MKRNRIQYALFCTVCVDIFVCEMRVFRRVRNSRVCLLVSIEANSTKRTSGSDRLAVSVCCVRRVAVVVCLCVRRNGIRLTKRTMAPSTHCF